QPRPRPARRCQQLSPASTPRGGRRGPDHPGAAGPPTPFRCRCGFVVGLTADKADGEDGNGTLTTWLWRLDGDEGRGGRRRADPTERPGRPLGGVGRGTSRSVAPLPVRLAEPRQAARVTPRVRADGSVTPTRLGRPGVGWEGSWPLDLGDVVRCADQRAVGEGGVAPGGQGHPEGGAGRRRLVVGALVLASAAAGKSRRGGGPRPPDAGGGGGSSTALPVGFLMAPVPCRWPPRFP